MLKETGAVVCDDCGDEITDLPWVWVDDDNAKRSELCENHFNIRYAAAVEQYAEELATKLDNGRQYE